MVTRYLDPSGYKPEARKPEPGSKHALWDHGSGKSLGFRVLEGVGVLGFRV